MKSPTKTQASSALKTSAVACLIEFDGERAHLFLEANRSREERQTFEVLIGSVKFEVRYELPRSRARALRTLKRGSFNSHTMTADAITDLPGKPGFTSFAHDWFRGHPRSRKTWRGVPDITPEEAEAEDKKERTSVYEYLSRGGYRAVTLEMADGRLVTVRSPDKAFTPEEFLNGPGRQILNLLTRNS